MPGGESGCPTTPPDHFDFDDRRTVLYFPLFQRRGVPMPIGEYCVCSSIFIKQEDVHLRPITSTGHNSGEDMYPANRCFFREPGQSSLALPRTTSKSLTAVSVLLLVFKGFDQLVKAHEGGLSLGDSFLDSTFRNIGLSLRVWSSWAYFCHSLFVLFSDVSNHTAWSLAFDHLFCAVHVHGDRSLKVFGPWVSSFDIKSPKSKVILKPLSRLACWWRG